MKAQSDNLYRATPEELKAIDEAIAEVERGEIASDEEVEAVFAKYRVSPPSSPGLSR
jgi:predicted transcriptional regulator